MSYDFEYEDPHKDLYDAFSIIAEALDDLVNWSRDETHALYAGANYEIPYGLEWHGPTDDFLTAKAWELVALLKCK
jgi:hypothetical protein